MIRPSNVLSHITGKQVSTAIQSLAMPDEKIKGRIHSNAFDNFGALLFNVRHNDHNQRDITDDQAALTSKLKPVPKIQTMDQWFEAFHISVAIYTDVHNCQTSALMMYANNTEQGMARRSGEVAAMFYDENFRK